MLNKIALAVLIIALAWGLEQVVVSPLSTGAVYPEYSSLRSDPKGSMALYESLGKVVEVRRLYKSREQSDPGPGTTIFILGVDPVAWSQADVDTLKEYESLTGKGARLAIAFLPVSKPWPRKKDRPVEARWDIHFALDNSHAEDELPVKFRVGAKWRALTSHAVERPLGAGTIVLIADSYPLSNEGLREARDVSLIAQIAGPAREIVFDENHFGVIETGSITKLMRKYHLEGALAVLALVAGLFLWRSASSLLPSRAPRAEQAVTGRDSLEGMTALLRRGIPEKNLVRVCYEEWRKTSLNDVKTHDVDANNALFDAKNVVVAYKALMERL